MSFYHMSDDAISQEMGQRLKTTRLNKNMTQKDVAEFSQLSLTAIKSLEKGKGTLVNFIKVLRALKQLDALNLFLPKPEISPRQMARLKGKTRTRATGSRKQ